MNNIVITNNNMTSASLIYIGDSNFVNFKNFNVTNNMLEYVNKECYFI